MELELLVCIEYLQYRQKYESQPSTSPVLALKVELGAIRAKH